jgi:hypothetical protein
MKVVTPVVLLVPSNFDCEGRAACSNLFFNLKKVVSTSHSPVPHTARSGAQQSPRDTQARRSEARKGQKDTGSETLNMSSDK